MLKRYIEKFILKDIAEKMVFVAGPRQVGKTTFAQYTGDRYFPDKTAYLNWDSREDRKDILKGKFRADKEFVIFDEIHKYKGWKNYLKGEYDKYKKKFKIMVTGSARLDIYRRGGDSLLGRYFLWRLHPFSLKEMLNKKTNIEIFKELNFEGREKENAEYFNVLMRFGGFPEMIVKQSESALRRWHNERINAIVREDIRDIENIRDLSALQILVELLPAKVGSLLSLNSLREDLNVAHKTVSSWMDILEKFYCHFRIYPFKSGKIKSLKKEPKLYLWDWTEVKKEGAKLENMAASHLLKFCQFLFDAYGWKADLFFLRDIEGREADFLVAVDNKPWFCAEIKLSAGGGKSNLKYFANKLKIPFVYKVVGKTGVDYVEDKIRVISADKFLSAFV